MSKRIAGLAVAIATGAAVLTAPPAAAATVSVEYLCGVVGMVIGRTFDITITAPSTAPQGQPVTVTASVVSRHPLSQPTAPGAYRGQHTVDLGGAGAGSFTITGMANPQLQAGEPWQITGSTQVTFTTPGTITLRPGYTGFTHPAGQGCKPRYPETVPAAATVVVS
ncbi:hypothetical protein [Actinokineospora sp. NPDC004072]